MRHPGHFSPAPAGAADCVPVLRPERAPARTLPTPTATTSSDYMCAYGPMVLGYDNKVVHDAAARQRKLGDTLGLPVAGDDRAGGEAHLDDRRRRLGVLRQERRRR